MPNEELSRRHFQKKISTYCDVRLAPVAPDWIVENIRPYLLGLISASATMAHFFSSDPARNSLA
nr:hypothetical protein RNT25_04172 [arsenite-oxidising bacterium NT-25]